MTKWMKEIEKREVRDAGKNENAVRKCYQDNFLFLTFKIYILH